MERSSKNHDGICALIRPYMERTCFSQKSYFMFPQLFLGTTTLLVHVLLSIKNKVIYGKEYFGFVLIKII